MRFLLVIVVFLTIMITGAEWKSFYHSGAWPDGYVWGSESTLNGGTDLFADDGSLTISDGEKFVVPTWWYAVREHDPEGPSTSVRTLIRKWRKDLAYVTVVLTIPKTEAAWAMEEFTRRKWKVG